MANKNNEWDDFLQINKNTSLFIRETRVNEMCSITLRIVETIGELAHDPVTEHKFDNISVYYIINTKTSAKLTPIFS